MVSLCRIKTGNQVKEKYVLGEKTLRGEEISRVSPVKIEWKIEVTRKAPVSFSSSLLSIEYAARILIVEDKKQKMIKEIPLTVIPGRIDESEMEQERRG